jgi:hypothetical protein
MHLVQETFQQYWPEIVRQLLAETGSHLDTIYEQALHQLQERMRQQLEPRGDYNDPGDGQPSPLSYFRTQRRRTDGRQFA